MSRQVPSTVVSFGRAEQEAVAAVLASGRVVQGDQVAAFEDEFAAVVGGRACVAVNSGTSALHLALLAHGVGPGDEVIVPSFSFAATANAVAVTGATPVFADIDPATFCLDPEHVATLVTPRTVAVIPVHLYGQLADMTRIADVAGRAGLLVLEDAAQAHAASLDGVPAGAWGQVAAFSFYATKNLTTGEGGMVVCEDAATARRVRLLRNQGMERQYHNEVAGLNNRMTEVAAAIGRVRLPDLTRLTAARRAVAARYDEQLAGHVVVPAVRAGAEHVYHQYTVRVAGRDQVAARLADRGVEARVFYPVPIHRLPVYAGTGGGLPHTEQAALEVLSLPVHPGLDADDVAHVVSELVAAVEAVR